MERLTLKENAPSPGDRWSFLILVKTYPVPSKKYGKTVSCAAIETDAGRRVRIYPVNEPLS